MLKRLLITSFVLGFIYFLSTQPAFEEYFFDYRSSANQPNYTDQHRIVEEEEVAEIVELNKQIVYENTSKPISLKIPSLKVSAAIQEVGLTSNGAMETIDDPEPIGWYKFGALPGGEGNALLAGHREWYGELGSLFKLEKMKVGEDLIISYENGQTQTFELVSNVLYKLDEVPKEVMAVDGEARVTLITCAGTYSKRMGTYDSRAVAVFKKVRND